MLEKIGALLQGKKTYIIAILIGLGAVAENLGYIVPDIIWPILGALGLGAVRSALDKLKA
jgi:hypothetical protein